MAKTTEMVEVSPERLRPYEKNAKVHTQGQLDKLKKSIEKFGFISPCLIDKDGNIIAGHGRVEAAKQLGMKTVPCVYIEGLTEEQRRAYILADNRLTELGGWDSELLAQELKDLNEGGFDVSVTGFDLPEELTEPEDLEKITEDPTEALPESRVFIYAISAFGTNSAEFIEKNRQQQIDGYEFRSMTRWLRENKTDDVFLISPEDAIEETAAQISYKTDTKITRTIRASKCEVLPVPKDLALDFFIRNHRQTAPKWGTGAVCFGLVFQNELVAVMLYSIQGGAVRGQNFDYELVRLSIAKGARIHGGASKLQAACEETLRAIGVHEIFSYSNATINTGAVYEKLGFKLHCFKGGQPFVILKDNRLERLVNLNPYSTDDELAARGLLKTHLGGNKTWKKEI